MTRVGAFHFVQIMWPCVLGVSYFEVASRRFLFRTNTRNHVVGVFFQIRSTSPFNDRITTEGSKNVENSNLCKSRVGLKLFEKSSWRFSFLVSKTQAFIDDKCAQSVRVSVCLSVCPSVCLSAGYSLYLPTDFEKWGIIGKLSNLGAAFSMLNFSSVPREKVIRENYFLLYIGHSWYSVSDSYFVELKWIPPPYYWTQRNESRVQCVFQMG